MKRCSLPLGLLLGAFFIAQPQLAHAGIVFNAGAGGTVYGASNYTCAPCDFGAPVYISNNITGLNDILASPGNGYQVANPVVANNLAETPGVIAAPYSFSLFGGNNVNGPFGAGATTDTGPSVSFALSDATLGCCAASYMVTSVFDSYTVDANGFAGNLGSYLSIAGSNPTGNDASVASAIVEYSFNNPGFNLANFIALPQMVLAASGNCATSSAIGGVGGGNAAMINAACTNGGNGGAFSGLAADNFFANLAPFTTIQVIATVTAYADPASISAIEPDLSLFPSVSVPDVALVDVATPEPGTSALLGGGLGLAVLLLRRRRK